MVDPRENLKKNAQEDESRDGAVSMERGRDGDRGSDETNGNGTGQEQGEGQGQGQGGGCNNSTIPRKKRGRPRKNPQMPVQPTALNQGASSHACSTSSVAGADELPNTLGPKRGRISNSEKERLKQLNEMAQKASEALQNTETTAEAPTASAPSLPLGDNSQQQHHDWPPLEPTVPHPEPASKGDPWLSWFPKMFAPSTFSNIQSTLVIRAEEQQPLVCGCSWPVYTIHRFYQPKLKRNRGRRDPSTIQNTRDPSETRPQAQRDTLMQEVDLASARNPDNFALNSSSYQGGQAQVNTDQQAFSGAEALPNFPGMGYQADGGAEGTQSLPATEWQANGGAEGTQSFPATGWQAYNGAEGMQTFPDMGGHGNAMSTPVVDQQGLAGQGNFFATGFMTLQGFPGQFEYDAGQGHADNSEILFQQGLQGHGNVVNTGQGDSEQLNGINIHQLYI